MRFVSSLCWAIHAAQLRFVVTTNDISSGLLLVLEGMNGMGKPVGIEKRFDSCAGASRESVEQLIKYFNFLMFSSEPTLQRPVWVKSIPLQPKF